MYFVRRKGRVKGPLSREKLAELQQEDRLRMRDEIGASANGPWQRLIDVYDEIFGAESAAFETDTPADEAFWDEEPSGPQPPKKLASKTAGKSKPATAPKSKTAVSGGLFGGRVKPWQVIAAVSGGTGVLGLMLAAWMLWAPLTEAPSDPNEIAATINAEKPGPVQKKKPRPRVATQKETASNAGGTAAPASTGSAPEPQAGQAASTQPVADAAEEQPSNDGEAAAATTPEPPTDPAEAIKSLLTAYYSAGDWQARYGLVKQGDKAKFLMRKLYEDVDWISVQWNITKMPGANELATAAAGGEPVRIDTLTNGNPHSIYVVFADGRWQVDWLESLETLWLTR